MIIDDEQRLRDAIAGLLAATQELDVAVDVAIHGFVRDCRMERSDRRKDIAMTHEKKQSYSQVVLLYRVLRGNIELAWSRIWYLKGHNTPRYKRIPSAKGKVHLARLKSGAHGDEVDLILLHEVKARSYRELNHRARSLLHEVDRLKSRYDILTGREFGLIGQ